MGQDPSEIRHEIERTRARMGDTVEALGYKADVPARVKDAVNDRVETVKGTIGEVVDSVKQTMGDASDKMGKALGGARETARSGMSQAGEKMGSMGEMRERMAGSMGDVRERVSGSMGEMQKRIGEKMPSPDDVRGMASKVGMAVENPLGLALGALALGFIAGLLIPVTSYEREKVGPIRDDLLERAQHISGDVVEHGRAVFTETAQATMAAAQQAAQQHGQQVLAGGLEPETLVSNALEHGKQMLRETADVALRTAQQSVEQHGKHIVGEARGDEVHASADGQLNANRVPPDRSGMTGDTGSTSGHYGVLLDGGQTPER